ncbi:hypothetical protein, partial [Staphylococcus felis]|uniref:hypothetical protein n=1 Tax=Staphylococcus felis TaxID=46127 RepID=UPI00115A1BA6
MGVNIPHTGDTQFPPTTRTDIPQGVVHSGWTVTINPNNRTLSPTPPSHATPGTSVDTPVQVTHP